MIQHLSQMIQHLSQMIQHLSEMVWHLTHTIRQLSPKVNEENQKSSGDLVNNSQMSQKSKTGVGGTSGFWITRAPEQTQRCPIVQGLHQWWNTPYTIHHCNGIWEGSTHRSSNRALSLMMMHSNWIGTSLIKAAPAPAVLNCISWKLS